MTLTMIDHSRCLHTTPDFISHWPHVAALLKSLNDNFEAVRALSHIVKRSCNSRACTPLEELISVLNPAMNYLGSNDDLARLFLSEEPSSTTSAMQADHVVMQDAANVSGDNSNASDAKFDHSTCKHEIEHFSEMLPQILQTSFLDKEGVWTRSASSCNMYGNDERRIQQIWGENMDAISKLLEQLRAHEIQLVDVLDRASAFQKLTKSPSQSSIVDSGTFDAFNADYQGDLPRIFLNTLDGLAAKPNIDEYHSRSVSFVQSSCTGKTRLIHEVAKHRITLIMNIRETLPDNQFAFPPSDDLVRDYLKPTQRPISFEKLVFRYKAFLSSLFAEASNQLLKLDFDVERWDNFMYSWDKRYQWNSNHQDFWGNVVNAANSATKFNVKDNANALLNTIPTPVEPPRKGDAKTAQNPVGASEKVKLLIVIDEAHVLTDVIDESLYPQRTYLNALERALKSIRNLNIFTIFLSTNSKLVPPATPNPSRRGGGLHLFPPFTEFVAFDVFARKDWQESKGRVWTLETPCSPKLVTSFGRPHWRAMLNAGKKLPRIITFARRKLMNTTAFSVEKVGCESPAKFAWMSIRIMLDFDVCARARPVQSALVESYMRVVYSIPEHRENMLTGTPSEPILVEAAAQLMDEWKFPCQPKLGFPWFLVLHDALSGGLLAKSDRSEVVFRALFMRAYDKACKLSEDSERNGLKFHRPIPLLHFLKTLLRPEIYNEILKATPVVSTRHGKTPSLEEAFENAWIHASHFIQAGDYNVVQLPHLAQFFARGGVVQCCDSQKEIDVVVPIAFAADGHNIDAFSAVQMQINNRIITESHRMADAVRPLPEKAAEATEAQATEADKKTPKAAAASVEENIDYTRPMLSIVFELRDFEENQVTILRSAVQARRFSKDSRQYQYQITVRGLLPFNLEPQELNLVRLILDIQSGYKEFPRQELGDNVDLLGYCQPKVTTNSMENWRMPVKTHSDDTSAMEILDDDDGITDGVQDAVTVTRIEIEESQSEGVTKTKIRVIPPTLQSHREAPSNNTEQISEQGSKKRKKEAIEQ